MHLLKEINLTKKEKNPNHFLANLDELKVKILIPSLFFAFFCISTFVSSFLSLTHSLSPYNQTFWFVLCTDQLAAFVGLSVKSQKFFFSPLMEKPRGQSQWNAMTDLFLRACLFFKAGEGGRAERRCDTKTSIYKVLLIWQNCLSVLLVLVRLHSGRHVHFIIQLIVNNFVNIL